MPRRWKIFLLVTFLSLVLDQGTKIWARHSLPLTPAAHCQDDIVDKIANRTCFGEPVTVISNIWDFRLSMNPGSAFGLFHSTSNARIFLSLVGIGALFGMAWMVRRAKDKQTWLVLALGLIAGGAIGNLVDRIYYGVVTDFVLWHYKDTEWPVFNVADAVLVVGVVLLVFDVGNDGKKKKKPKKANLPKAEVAGKKESAEVG
jgi:signal peptidase II